MNTLRKSIQLFYRQGVRLSSRAAILQSFNQPLIIEKLILPSSLETNSVKIKVQYCSLNSNDVKYIENGNHDLPFIPGYELSGEISEIGNNSDFSVGQRVVGLIPKRCGGLASHVLMDDSDIWEIPSEVATRDAAALVYGHSTALLAFTEKCPLYEGDVILIIVGAGGFGLAAVDIAANIFKAKVIALADTEGKASLLRERGAFAAFKYDLKRNHKEVMEATDGKGVDLIYDAVGGSILNIAVKCLKDKENGTILLTYNKDYLELSTIKAEEDLKDNKKSKEKIKEEPICQEILERAQQVSLTNYRIEDMEKYHNIVEQVLNFSEDGLITAHISQDFQLEEINEAIAYIKGKMCTGKVIIHIDNDK